MIVSIVTLRTKLKTWKSPDYPLTKCKKCKKVGTILEKGRDWDESHLIQSLPKTMVESILQGNICAYSFHGKCIPIDFLDHPALADFRWVATSTEHTKSKPKDFLAIFENTDYGWFGTQFHTEKAYGAY